MPASLCPCSMSSASSSASNAHWAFPANSVFLRRAEPRQETGCSVAIVAPSYRSAVSPASATAPAVGCTSAASATRPNILPSETNLRFLITNCLGRASQVFAFYNDRGECENRIEEFKIRFPRRSLELSRTSWPTLPPAAATAPAYNRQPVPLAVAPALALGPDRKRCALTVQNRRSRSPDRPLCSLSTSPAAALPELVALCRLRRQQQLTGPLSSRTHLSTDCPCGAMPKNLSAATRTLLARMLSPCSPLLSRNLSRPTVSPNKISALMN